METLSNRFNHLKEDCVRLKINTSCKGCAFELDKWNCLEFMYNEKKKTVLDKAYLQMA